MLAVRDVGMRIGAATVVIDCTLVQLALRELIVEGFETSSRESSHC